MRIVREAGAQAEDIRLDLPLPEDAKGAAENFFAEHSQFPGVIAVHPGCSKFERRWHAERFAELGRKLAKRLGVGIILVGSGTEKPMLTKIARQIGEECVKIFTTLEPLELAAVIARTKLFVGNDSGVSHLAEAVHTKSVVIYGSSAPWETGPFEQSPSEYRAVQKDFPCRPCRERFFSDCKPSVANKPPCMEEITVGNVMKAVEELWAGR
jgi:ADP-heptose:LPS heptosyltransferase